MPRGLPSCERAPGLDQWRASSSPIQAGRKVGLKLAAALLLLWGGVSSAAEPFAAGVLIAPPAGWTPEQTPVDFLDIVGLQTKARWRQMYREPPPSPPTERTRAAFMLGALIADGFLALQAEDAQQLRNNNQDILGYCRVLGLGEKASPRLMAMGKLAESSKWTDLRQEAVDGHMELGRLLHDQHDDDLAILMDLGVWLRVLEIASSLVAAAPDAGVKPLCIGSCDLLKELQARFAQLSDATRKQELIAMVGENLDLLHRHWSNVGEGEATQEFVDKTHDRLRSLMRKATLK